MADHFTVRVVVRGYEIDLNGHVNHSNYHRYAEHARTEHLAAAGCSMFQLVEQGMGIVLLETTCRFLSELRYGDDVEIDSRVSFGAGKTFAMAHTVRRSDGVVAAEVSCTLGVIDSAARKLVADPRTRLLELATAPELLTS